MLRHLIQGLFVGLLLTQYAWSEWTPRANSSDFDGGHPNVPSSDILEMLPGIAQPSQEVKLAAPLDGVLMRVLVQEGDQVDSGHILAQMDNRVSEADVRLAELVSSRTAAIARAEFELILAEKVLERILSVEDRDAVSELEIDQARGQRDQAKALLDQAREQALESQLNLELARTRLEAHNIRAPFDGLVLRVEARVGETVTGSDSLITLASLKELRAELYVPIEWYGRLEVGASYRLAAAHPVNRAVVATLVTYEPVVDAATQTFRCVFTISNTNDHLPAGFAVRLVRPDQSGNSSGVAIRLNEKVPSTPFDD